MTEQKQPTRSELLARPKKYRISHKYVGEPPRIYMPIERPVVPLNNRRLAMLAENVKFKKTPKYELPRIPSTTLNRAVLEAQLTPRLDHLSRPFVIKLQATRAKNKFLGKAYQDMMSERIGMSWDTIYYFNKKSKQAAELEKKGQKKVKPKKIWSEENNRLDTLAVPKTVHKPLPLEKRPRKPVEFFKKRLTTLALPHTRCIYKRPSQNSFIKQERRRLKNAGKYITSDRMKKLNTLPEHRLRKERPPFFGVKRGALQAEMTERLEELAAPRARAKAPDMDVKENAYEISPGALKYKATPRIIKLAKPVER